MALRIGINGFGRIGRTVYRILANRDDIQIVGVNDVAESSNLAYLLKYDTVMGRFPGDVTFANGFIEAGEHKVAMSQHRDPRQIPWQELGADVIVEATGRFRTKETCEKHIEAGAKKVLLTVPAKDEIDITIVLGVNDHLLKPEHTIISNASCTTNCLAPIAKVLHENFGIKKGFMSTVHAYTNDQRLADYTHTDLRRARAANENIIPTTTGAAKAVGIVIPDLQGKLDGMALRVPVADGSSIDLVTITEKTTTAEEVNQVVREAANSQLEDIVEYCEDPIVSSDILQNSHSAVFDAAGTMVMDGNFVKTFAWYDNEWGYSARLVNVIEKLQTMG